jgi:2'-5' RNA ligase
VKFVETDNRGFIKEGKNAGKSYSSVYGKKAGRIYDEDIDDPLSHSAKEFYNERLNRVETVFSEAYQDAMVSLKTAQNAIAGDKDIPDSQNAYMAENLMHGKNKNEMDLYNKELRDPLIKTINKIMNLTGMNWGDVDRYVYTKSGLERNREFFVRDWLEDAIANVVSDFEPFSIRISGCGAFPNTNRIKVICVGIDDDKIIRELHNRLDKEFIRLGFDKDKKFSTHLTIGRMKSAKNKDKVKSTLEGFGDIEIGEMEVNRISLKKSTLTPSGPIYEDLKIFEL